MQHIFLDSSIFIKENFLEGKRLNQLFEMGKEKKIQLVLPLITIKEVKSRYELSCKKASEEYNSLLKQHDVQALRNFSALSSQFKKLPKLAELTREFEQNFDKT